MELYTLSSKFLPKESVGQFTSAIWTERYFSSGDMQLVVQADPSRIEKLSKGTLVGLRGTKEIMMIETQSVEDGLLTVTGSSILEFLNQRQAWFWNPEYDSAATGDRLASEYTKDTLTAGQLISEAVDKMVINPTTYLSYWSSINLDWPNEKIPGLQLGLVDGNGTPKRLSVPIGQLYDSIQRLAEEEGLGLKLYLESARYNGGLAPPDYVLKFSTYRGKNRTSEQSVHTLMRLSPKLDSLTDVKEINSIANYKNVFYVLYKNIISTHYIPGLPIPTGFERRVILVEAPDIYLEESHIPPFREQVARNTIANHVYIQAVDGQISQQTGYTFGTDYYLGDIIELEGFTGILSKARVTEYIRSEDQFGEKAYPTLAVLDPLFVGYMPDLEPNFNFDPGFDEDPDFDFDFDFTDEEDLSDPEVSPPLDDPRDPPEFNPDPTYDFGDPGDGGNGDGEPSVGDHGLLPLTPFESADWYYDTNLGYYVHQGRVYIIGQASAEGVEYLGSDTLLLNIPSELAPESPVSSRVLIDHQNSTIEYAFDSGLQIGPWLDVTVNPNGTVTLDDGNPYHPVSELETSIIVLTLSGIDWPTSMAVADTYSPTGSFDDYIASEEHIRQLPFLESVDTDAWSNLDGNYSVHDNTFHLDGKVKAENYAQLIAPLILIPPIHQPKQSSESNRGSPRCEVAQKDGYKFGIALPRQGLNHNLTNSQGAQNPQACGNTGRGSNATHFHARNRDGQILRGYEVASVNPDGYGDEGVEYVTCSGTPIPGAALEEAGWYGSSYSASFTFKKEDLHLQANPSVDNNFSYGGGQEQLSFVIGYGLPGVTARAYYKMVYTIDEVGNVWWQLLINEPAQQPRVEFTMDAPFDYDNAGTYIGRFTIDISTRWQDVDYLEDPVPEYPTQSKYFKLTDTAKRIYQFYDEDMFLAEASTVGHMCYHFPQGSSCQLLSANIHGLGDFPALIEPGDVIDFTGAKWPLT